MNKEKYVALLRGINVGGHHKLPMAQLREEMGKLGFTGIKTLLNSGNVVFTASGGHEAALEDSIEKHLEQAFGFPVPTLVRKASDIVALVQRNPFEKITPADNIRFYVTFLKEPSTVTGGLPRTSEENGFRILSTGDKSVCSVLDITLTQSTKGMDTLGKMFGKNITTRNWNTLVKVSAL